MNNTSKKQFRESTVCTRTVTLAMSCNRPSFRGATCNSGLLAQDAQQKGQRPLPLILLVRLINQSFSYWFPFFRAGAMKTGMLPRASRNFPNTPFPPCFFNPLKLPLTEVVPWKRQESSSWTKLRHWPGQVCHRHVGSKVSDMMSTQVCNECFHGSFGYAFWVCDSRYSLASEFQH